MDDLRPVSSGTVKRARSIAVPTLCLALAALDLARADDVGPGPVEIRLPAPGSAPWRPVEFPRIDRHTLYEAEETSGSLHASSDCAASGLILELDEIDLTRTPRLRWRWRVSEVPTVDDERTGDGDDFAARVYVTFPFDPDQVSWLDRIRHQIGRRLFGRELPGRALSFVWSQSAAVGESWPSPFDPNIRMRAVTRGPVDGWRTVEVDIASFWRESFGSPPPRPSSLALMTDSDQSCSRAQAWYADFRLRGPLQEGVKPIEPPSP